MRKLVTVITCDRCGGELESPISFSVQTGYQAGAVSQEDVIKDTDLCVVCAGRALTVLFCRMQSFDVVTEALKLILTKE